MPIDVKELHQALTEALSTHDVRYDRLTRALYATDASVYQIVPLLVAFPATAADVAAKRLGGRGRPRFSRKVAPS